MKTTVIHHSADYDGLFCREIARKFLPDAELIGWDFKDTPLQVPEGQIYVLDLPLDAPFGGKHGQFNMGIIMAVQENRLIWIDHHASSITSHAPETPGYRIDGVAACRLAWQWFSKTAAATERPCPGCGAMAHPAKVPCEQGKPCPHCGGIHWGSGFCPYTEDSNKSSALPVKQHFLDRKVTEPLAVRLAGEYDIWDHRGDGDLEFQFGLDAQPNIPWGSLLGLLPTSRETTVQIVRDGQSAMRCYAKRDGDVMRERSFLLKWENLTFLALNTARCNANTFNAKDVPETGHDALLAFYWNGRAWTISLYHAAHRKDIDLSLIAVKYKGGGHRGACGMTTRSLPFPTP